MGFQKHSHDPDAVLDYPFDFAALLSEVNDTISTAEVATPTLPLDAPTGITVGTVTIDSVNHIVTAWISGGTAGESYTVTCHITTDDGREEDLSMILQCKEH